VYSGILQDQIVYAILLVSPIVVVVAVAGGFVAITGCCADLKQYE
jgi:hypothetical protein